VRPEFAPLSLAKTVWKRKILILLIWVAASGATYAVVRRLPATYRAEALIIVEGQRIPERYVSATVNDDLNLRLSTISQQILSYTRLAGVIEKFELYREDRPLRTEEEIVNKMREDISIGLEQGWSPARPGAFRVAYVAKDPVVTAQVANQLANFFIDENLRTREVQAVGTSEFLETQLAEAEKTLEQQEATLSQYKTKFMGELPEQQGTLLATASRLQSQIREIQEATNRGQQSKLMLQNSLESAKVAYGALLAAGEQGTLRPAVLVPGVVREPSSIDAANAKLEQLRLRYSDDHPDVTKARSELVRLLELAKQQEAAAERLKDVKGSNAVIPAATVPQEVQGTRESRLAESRIRSAQQIHDLEQQISLIDEQLNKLERDRQQTLASMTSVQSAIDRLPMREQELTGITRDYQISRTYYQSLLDKKLAADLAANMEKYQKAERFIIQDMARVPVKPLRPNRRMLFAAGWGLGLVLGLVVAFGWEFKKNVVLGEWELPPDLVVLGRVPVIRPGKPGKLSIPGTAPARA